MRTEVTHCYIYLNAPSNTRPMPSTPQPYLGGQHVFLDRSQLPCGWPSLLPTSLMYS